MVLCHGVFDILHAGHLEYFKAAKAFGDILVVSLTADRYVNKGPGRPCFTAEIRAQMIDSLKIVDYVTISNYPTAVEVINAVKPSFYVKGPDYADNEADITGEIRNEVQAVRKNGGEVKYTTAPTFSSSTLANRFLVNWSDDQQQTIERMRELNCAETLRRTLEDIAKFRVCVVGEPIIDTYRFVEPQGISSKSPSISAKYLYEENYEGGAFAITNHLKTFVRAVSTRYPINYSVPQKIRYIEQSKSQRIFEVTKIDDQWWAEHNPEQFVNSLIASVSNMDICILADFGHGLFEGEVVEWCRNIRQFVALNVQTNSSNFGFNPFTKHSEWDYLSIDKRELQVAFHDNKTDPIRLSLNLNQYAHRTYSITLGPNGSVYFDDGHDHVSPAFADKVVDATGAGDAYFAITSLLVKAEMPPEMIPFIGNVYAGLKTKIIGNKESVTKAQLVKAVESILK